MWEFKQTWAVVRFMSSILWFKQIILHLVGGNGQYCYIVKQIYWVRYINFWKFTIKFCQNDIKWNVNLSLFSLIPTNPKFFFLSVKLIVSKAFSRKTGMSLLSCLFMHVPHLPRGDLLYIVFFTLIVQAVILASHKVSVHFSSLLELQKYQSPFPLNSLRSYVDTQAFCIVLYTGTKKQKNLFHWNISGLNITYEWMEWSSAPE